MARRTYTLGRRGAAAEETRRRIVEATAALHAQRGILRTTMKDIAERAGVGVGTVYHHFPTYDDAVQACAELHRDLLALPGPEVFDGARDRAERVRALSRAVFALWDSAPGLERVRAEQADVPVVRAFFRDAGAALRALAAEALGQAGRPGDAELMLALLELQVCRALTEAGLSADDAADRVAEVLNAWRDAVESQPQ